MLRPDLDAIRTRWELFARPATNTAPDLSFAVADIDELLTYIEETERRKSMKPRQPVHVTTSDTASTVIWKTDPARSAGARYERAAFRARLRRRIKNGLRDAERLARKSEGAVIALVLQTELDWVLARQERYDKAPGGLGRTLRRRGSVLI